MKLSTLNFRSLATAAVLSALAIGCSSSSSSPSPASPSTSGSSGTKPTALSSQFTASCVVCHGSDGSTVPAGSTLAALKGFTTYGETSWTNAIRSGMSGTSMAAFTTTAYSDTSKEADYWFLTGNAW